MTSWPFHFLKRLFFHHIDYTEDALWQLQCAGRAFLGQNGAVGYYGTVSLF